jgi:hypothetical protein
MKSLVLILILIAMNLNLMSQNYVYDSKGAKKPFKSEDIDIEFTDSSPSVWFPAKVEQPIAPAVIAMLPTLLNIGFQLTTSILEERVKKFTAEYTKSKSYLNAGESTVPNFIFVRTVTFNKDPTVALSIRFIAHKIEKIDGFIYYIDEINLANSSAKATSDKNTFDYSIEIKPTYLINNEKKVIELSPISVSSVGFSKNQYPALKNRTEIIPLPKGAILTEMSLKIVESNPAKVRAERILSVWNTYKDSTKTIINNFLPKDIEGASSRIKPAGNSLNDSDSK